MTSFFITMNRKIKQTNLPSQAIQELVMAAIEAEYHLKWVPRVVRQNKKLYVGSLNSIDYAVPCFELSQAISETPQVTAQKIAKLINNKKISFKVEAVGGFVNFELNQDYFNDSINFAKDWFKSPHIIGDFDRYGKLIVVSPRIISRAPRKEVTALAYKYVDQLHALLDIRTSAQFLVSDYSIETVEYLSFKTRPKIKRTVNRQIIHNYELLDHEVAALALEKLRARLKKFQTPNEREAWTNFIPVFESEIATNVHLFLDKLVTSSSRGIVADSSNAAIYLSSNDAELPLRSSGGLLSRFAYVIFLVDSALKSANSKTSVVLFVPQIYHLYIYAWAEQMYGDKVGPQLVCFDPHVSKADILDIFNSIKSLKSHFKQISKILHEVQNRKNTPDDVRSDMLSLVDFSTDLNEFLGTQKFPALFDALNHTNRVVKKLIKL